MSAPESDPAGFAADLSTASQDGAKDELSQAGQPLSSEHGSLPTATTTVANDQTTPEDPAAVTPPLELVAEEDNAIEAAESSIDSDEFEPSEWGDEGASNASTSINSSIYNHTYENGRRFHSYKNGRYPIPNDDQEQNREDMKHVMMLEMTDGKLLYAPIGDYPQKIIDIGTGTGKYSIGRTAACR